MRTIYRDNVIIFLKRSIDYPFGHYLLRVNSKWMDPWINLQKNKNIKDASSGYRMRLPGKPIYAVFTEQKF